MTRSLLIGLCFSLLAPRSVWHDLIDPSTANPVEVCIEEVDAGLRRKDFEAVVALTTYTLRYHRLSEQQQQELLVKASLLLEPSQAWELSMEALAHQRRGAEVLIHASHVRFYNGDAPSALELGNAALVLEPESPRPYEQLASACRSLPQLANSLHESAIALDPNDPRRYLSWSYALRDQGDFDRAVTAINTAIDMQPNDPVNHLTLGYTYLDMKDYDSALKHLRKAADLGGEGGEAWSLLAELYGKRSDTFERIYALRMAIRYDPQDAEAYVALGQIYTEQENFREAAAVYEEWTEAMPSSARAYYELALAYKRAGEPQRMRDALAQVRRLDPEKRKYGAITSFTQLGYSYVSAWDKLAAGIVAIALIATVVLTRRRAAH